MGAKSLQASVEMGTCLGCLPLRWTVHLPAPFLPEATPGDQQCGLDMTGVVLRAGQQLSPPSFPGVLRMGTSLWGAVVSLEVFVLA